MDQTKLKSGSLHALASMKEFEKFVRTYVESHPNLIQSFLTFCAIENTANGIREMLWSQMAKTFPGSESEKETTRHSLEQLAQKLVMDFKMDFSLTPKSNLWRPPEKTISQ